jgi:hypothetical protein
VSPLILLLVGLDEKIYCWIIQTCLAATFEAEDGFVVILKLMSVLTVAA